LVGAFHDRILGMFSINIALNTFRETGDYRKVSSRQQGKGLTVAGARVTPYGLSSMWISS